MKKLPQPRHQRLLGLQPSRGSPGRREGGSGGARGSPLAPRQGADRLQELPVPPVAILRALPRGAGGCEGRARAA